MESKVEHILFEHSYETESDDEQFIITDEDSNATTSIISWIVGLGLAVVGVTFHVSFLFLGLILVIYAIVSESKKSPKTIVFWKQEKLVTLHYNVFATKKIPFDKVKEFIATSRSGTNLTNPFEAGARQFEYDIFVRLQSGKMIKVMRLDFAEEHDHDMQELAYNLNSLTGTT